MHTAGTHDQDEFNTAGVTVPSGFRPDSISNLSVRMDRTGTQAVFYVERTGVVKADGFNRSGYYGGSSVWFTSDPMPGQ